MIHAKASFAKRCARWAGMFCLVVTAATAQVPRFDHVIIVAEENTSYSSVVGSSAMPYLNGLMAQYGLATDYYANTHPSIGNYFELTMGQVFTNSDGYSSTIDRDNVVRQLLAAGKTWKAYAESLPSVGWTGGDKYPYIKHHTPLAYSADVANSAVQKQNLVPFTQFAQDLANATLPAYAFVTPNQYHNAHDCPPGMATCAPSDKLRAADDWLKTNIAPLLVDPAFQNTLLVIVFDEAYSSDTTHGGGKVAMVAVSPAIPAGTRATAFYQHQSLLRTSLEALGVTSFPGAAASAPAMTDLFTSVAPPPPPPTMCPMSTVTPSVTICSPGATSPATVRVTAGTTSTTAVNLIQIYVDGVKKHETAASTVDTTVAMAAGSRRITVQARDTSGFWFKSTVYVSVQ